MNWNVKMETLSGKAAPERVDLLRKGLE